MIKLVGGNVQSLAGLVVPRGKVILTLSGDASILASPFGLVMSSIPITFQFDDSANLLGTCQIWSNAELTPATQYTVTFYDADGARINQAPLYWQFAQTIGQTVDIGTIVPFANPLATIPVPGPTGPQGLIGSLGPPGADGDDGSPGFGLPSGIANRASLGVDAKNWAPLGTIAGTGVTVGPLIWTGQFQQIYWEYIIGGYNGGTPVGRILCGSASISTTALTNGNGLNENGTNNATSVNVPGCPLAVTLSAIARSGHGFIKGASGSLKQITIMGMSGNPAVGTSPTVFQARSFFSDLGTNLLIQRLQLTVYDTLITTSASSQQFTSTTQLWAWGRFND